MSVIRFVALLATWLIAVAYPAAAQRVDTVRVGSAVLRGVRLELGSYTIESFRRVDGNDTPLSTTTQVISREERDGSDAYVIHTTHTSADGDTTIGVIVARVANLALLHHRVKATRDSAAVAVSDGYVTGWVVLPGEPVRLIDQRLEHPVFPIEGQIPWLFPLLPLEEGYRAAIPHYSQWEGRETWTTIRVVGADRRAIGGRVFDCWQVDGGELFPGYGVTYWVDKHMRRVVEGIARGAQGGPEFWSRVQVP